MDLGQFIQDVNNNLGLILAALTTLGLIIAKFKGWFSGIRKSFKKMDIALDVLGGRGPVLHPDTGVELAPALMPLNERLAVIEKQQSDTTDALKLMAQTQQQLVHLEGGIQKIEERWQQAQEEGQSIIKEWTGWRDEWLRDKKTEHERMWDAIHALEKN